MPGTAPHDPLDPTAPMGIAQPLPAVPRPGPVRSTSRSGVVLWSLVWLAIAVGAGVVVGLAVGFVYRSVSTQSDGWQDLAAIVLGLLAGVLTAAIVWIVAMTLAARRFVPVGRRLGVLGWSTLAVIGSPLLVVAIFALGGSSGAAGSPVLLALVLALFVTPPVLVAVRAAPGGRAPTADGIMGG